MTHDSVSIRDAATVILIRDRPRRGFEVLLVRRHGQSGFMGGAHVFPGGKLDLADCADDITGRVVGLRGTSAADALGEHELSESKALGLFVAGLRETFEESGVLLADLIPGDTPRENRVRHARARLHAGESFARTLSDMGATLRIDQLAPFARWITPAVEPRRFDTRFFVTRVHHTQQAEHDARETTTHAWLTPSAAVEASVTGDILLPPPTLKTLLELAEHESSESVLTLVRCRKPPRVEPLLRREGHTLTILLPGDEQHPEPQRALPGATRIVFEGGRFQAL